MARDIVIVACWRRPEMLFHCLSNLSKARGIDDCELWINEDNHEWPQQNYENIEVMTKASRMPARFTRVDPHLYWGNNYNVLNAYKEALASGAPHIYLVEEDVMVAEDFFEWHRAVQERTNPWVSIAVRHAALAPYMSPEERADPRLVVYTDSYASLGVCWKRENLKVVLEHFVPEYLEHPMEYLDARFPNSSSKGAHGAQDGLISRLIERDHHLTVFPTRPRAFHAGWYGYNRSTERAPSGTLSERIEAAGKALRDRGYLMAEYPDCEPCDLKSAPWDGELIEWRR